ncbi:MAG: hypothetical protein V1888_01850 [archaeon]
MVKFGIKSLFVFGLFILLSGFVFAYSQSVPNPGHGADEIFVYINGKVLSLQSAIDLGEFSFNFYSGGGVANQIDFGHNDVYIDVNGVGKNLQSAINDNSLCLFEGGSGSYSGVKNIGHSADKILVNFNGEKNLQSAINQGLFSGKWDKVASDVCNGQSFTRSRCGISEVGTGTKTTGACCVASSWTPATDTVCSGQIFTQYSNCGTTISATGSKNCAPVIEVPTGLSFKIDQSSINKGSTFTYDYSASSGSTVYYQMQWLMGGGTYWSTWEDLGSASCVNCVSAPQNTAGTYVFRVRACGDSSDSYCTSPSASDSVSVVCASHTSSSCYGGDVYWYDSCGKKETKKKDCTLPYSRGGCWNGYCVTKLTRHYSSSQQDHMLSICGVVGVCEASLFSTYSGAEMSFYVMTDTDYPAGSKKALYRLLYYKPSVGNLDHMMSVSSTEGYPAYKKESTYGYLLNNFQAGLSQLYRKRLIAGTGVDHMDTLVLTEGGANYAYDGFLGWVITSGVQVA